MHAPEIAASIDPEGCPAAIMNCEIEGDTYLATRVLNKANDSINGQPHIRGAEIYSRCSMATKMAARQVVPCRIST